MQNRLSLDSGLIVLRKPKGVTSADAVGYAKRLLRLDKVGHCGTLDPLAQGVLVLVFGKATRLSEKIMNFPKTYCCAIELGCSTESGDWDGKVIRRQDPSSVMEKQMQSVLSEFLGSTQQIPPMYSALHHKGKRLYELARRGITVERLPREIKVSELSLLDWAPPRACLRLVCSRGTYVRTLVSDMGERLGVGAVLSDLARECVGPFTLEESLSWTDLQGDMGKVEFHAREMMSRWEAVSAPL